MRVPVVPFLTPPDSAISHGGWSVATADGKAKLTEDLAYWDYQTTLELAAPVSIDRRVVTESCQLEWDSGLCVLVLARSNHTKAELVAAKLDVPLSDSFDLAVEIQLDGHELGGRLTLETLLVSTVPRPRSRLAPQHSGSILWRQSQWTNLEGVGAQFPTESIDFGAHGRDPRAGWELHLDMSDPDSLFMSTARLILNSEHPAIKKLLRGDRDDGTAQLLRTLNWDVTRQMIQVAISNSDIEAFEIDPETLSIGGTLRNLVATVFPRESLATLRSWLSNDPARIEVHLQHHCGLLK